MGPTGRPVAMPEHPSVNKWKGRAGLGRVREGAEARPSWSLEKYCLARAGAVRGPVGISLAA